MADPGVRHPFTRECIVKVVSRLALTCACLLLVACTTTQSPHDSRTVGGPHHSSRVDRHAHSGKSDPLIDAPHRATVTCQSETPVTVLQRFKEVRLACKNLGVSATIDEMRDAGWRLVNLDIGQEQETNNHVGFLVTVTMRKLF